MKKYSFIFVPHYTFCVIKLVFSRRWSCKVAREVEC